MRAWWPVVGLSLVVMAPLEAATRVTIPELKARPERYYEQTISLECYFDKESPIWVRALPDADDWLGFFVTGEPGKALTWSGEYYNLLFAPSSMRDALRSLRGGDKITLIGEVFHYQSTSFDGAGIHVTQLLSGWGPSANAIGESTPPLLVPTVSAASSLTPVQPPRRDEPLTEAAEKYAVTINGKRYEGLRFGDQYNFDGTNFKVDEQ